MKGIVESRKGSLVVTYTGRKRGGYSISPYSYTHVDMEVMIDPFQWDMCKPGDSVEFIIRKSKGEKFAVIDTESIQVKLENEIAEWLETGCKIHELTDKILSIIKKDKSMFITRHKAFKALKHVRDEFMDEDLSGNITDQMLKTKLNKL